MQPNSKLPVSGHMIAFATPTALALQDMLVRIGAAMQWKWLDQGFVADLVVVLGAAVALAVGWRQKRAAILAALADTAAPAPQPSPIPSVATEQKGPTP